MKDVVAIIAVKKKSYRLKNKNILEINGMPLFYYSIKPLLKCKLIDDVYISTNSKYVLNYCKQKKISTIWRGPNKSKTNEPLLDVLKYSYSNLNKSYKYILTILSNAPGHKPHIIDKAIKMIKENKLSEVRSFNSHGEENGLMVFNVKDFLKKFQISSYIGMVKSSAKEIHFKKEFEEFKKKSNI